MSDHENTAQNQSIALPLRMRTRWGFVESPRGFVESGHSAYDICRQAVYLAMSVVCTLGVPCITVKTLAAGRKNPLS